jgi:branched-chain amino acid transport system substrate-binding protein
MLTSEFKQNNLVKFLIFLIIVFSSSYCYTINNTNNSHSKIAVVAPFSGPYSAYGKQLLTAANKAIVDLNNQNNPLELIPFDDQCNPDIAKSIANKIILDHQIKAVIGHICSEATISASKIYAKNGLLHLIPMTINANLTEQNITTLFRMCGKDTTEAEYISNFIFKQFNGKKVAVLHSQDLYSKELAAHLQEQLAILKIFPTLYQSITIDQLNNPMKIKIIIKKLKKLDIDVIFFGGLYRETANLIKIMNHSKIKIPIIVPDSIATSGFIEALGTKKLAEGIIMSFQNLEPTILSKNIHGLELFGYAAVQTINTVLQNNPSKNGRILAHWLHQNKVNTILGEKSWDTSGNIINDEFSMYIWDANGQFSLIN